VTVAGPRRIHTGFLAVRRVFVTDSGVHRARTSNHGSLVSLPATWELWDLTNLMGVLGTESLMQLG
jgi:hypothetical protein